MASEDSVYKLSLAGVRVDWKAAANLVAEDGSMDKCYKAWLLSRAGARVDCKAAAKLVEEDGSMDECYRAVLLRHLNGRDDPREEKTNKCDVIGEMRKTGALNKTERLVKDAKCARCSSPLNKREIFGSRE